MLNKSMVTDAMYLRKVLFNLTCVTTAASISSVTPDEPATTILGSEECNIQANESFRIPVKSLSQVGKL